MTELPAPAQRLNEDPSVVNCVAYKRNGERVGDITIEAISDALEVPDNFVWVGLHEPDEAMLDSMQEEFGLHDLAIEDAHNAHQRTKVEAYGDSLFIVAQTAQLVDGHIALGETHIFLGPNYLLTVRHGASLTYTPARRNCEATPDLLALGPSYGLYAVLDFIVDNFLPIVTDFREELQALELDIFAETYKRQTIRRLYDMQRDLMVLRLAAVPLQDVTNQLMRQYPQLIDDEVRVYLRDVFDHVFRVNESIGAMREMLSVAMSVNVSLVTFRQNEVMKKLAGWVAMLAAPTLITSWYGMNFEHMPELAKPWAYPAVLVLIAVVVATIYICLKRIRWL